MKNQAKSILKLIVIGVIIGFLLILNTCINGKLSEREDTHYSAVYDINSAAGGKFLISDIYIGIPYTRKIVTKNEKGVEQITYNDGTIYYQPKSVKYEADFDTQIRTIGIYKSPVFTADVSIDSVFNFTYPVNNSEYTYKPKEAFLKLKMNDKSIISQPEFIINGAKYKTTFTGSSEEKRGITSYFNCTSGNVSFSTALRIRGAGEFAILLSSLESNLSVKSDWNSPGFKNFSYLPTAYNITEDGFTAEWNVPFDIGDSSNKIGFNYVQPINIYKMLDRAITYGFLFIIVPFIVLFLFEVFLSISLHPLHYLLCGAASIIFFLLLLSISEHISFAGAYLISASASGLLVSFYVASITGKIKLGFTMSLVFILMYGFLFLSLKSEDYALLIGSLFAFVVLALIMFITRKVNWANLKKEKIVPVEK